LSPLLSLKHIYKQYGNSDKPFFALKDISLTITSGEMVAIVGASGSGKSTLMNILGFLDTPTTGNYVFSQSDVPHLLSDELAHIRNQKIGFIFQSFFLLPRLSVLRNVMLPLFYRQIPKLDAEMKALAMLKKFNMESFAHHKPNQLSGGQQQRVAIARALIGDPEIILADEPTGALDSVTGSEVMEILLRLNRVEGRTIVIITHDREISRQCQRVIELKDGQLLSSKSTQL
jgi:putative ABC transport system ATP-binding protein